MYKKSRAHIGSLIKAQLKEQNISVQDFVEAVGIGRTAVYALFKKGSTNIDLLIKISEVLHYDFIGKYYDCELSCPCNEQISYTVSINTDKDLERLKQLSKKLVQLKEKSQ